MLEVKLAPELEHALEREARRARKTKATLVRDAVVQFLQELDDYQAVLASRKRRGRTNTLGQVRQRLGLDSY
jgi:predicted DNA-binding protein